MDYIFIYSINMLCTVNIKLLYFKILLIHGNEEINYVEQFNCCCISFRTGDSGTSLFLIPFIYNLFYF